MEALRLFQHTKIHSSSPSRHCRTRGLKSTSSGSSTISPGISFATTRTLRTWIRTFLDPPWVTLVRRVTPRLRLRYHLCSPLCCSRVPHHVRQVLWKLTWRLRRREVQGMAMAYRRISSLFLRDLPSPSLCLLVCLISFFFTSVLFNASSAGACLSPRGKVRCSGQALCSRPARRHLIRLCRLPIYLYWAASCTQLSTSRLLRSHQLLRFCTTSLLSGRSLRVIPVRRPMKAHRRRESGGRVRATPCRSWPVSGIAGALPSIPTQISNSS